MRFLVVITSALLSILWCADVLAHTEGNPVDHFSPGEFGDPCFEKDCDKGRYYDGGHGHIDSITPHVWGYWTCGGYAAATETSEEGCDNDDKNGGNGPIISGTTTQTYTTTPQTPTEVIRDVVEESVDLDESKEIPEEPEVTKTPVQWVKQDFFYGFNFVSFPVQPPDVVTISDFWHKHIYWFSDTSIHTLVDGCWVSYSGGPDERSGDIPIDPYRGFVFYVKDKSLTNGFVLAYSGIPYERKAMLDIPIGNTLLGLSQIPVGVVKPSDLLELGAVVVLVEVDRELYLVGRAGDPGDVELETNSAVMVVAQQPITLNYEVAAAPSAPVVHRKSVTVTSWGAVKRNSQ